MTVHRKTFALWALMAAISREWNMAGRKLAVLVIDEDPDQAGQKDQASILSYCVKEKRSIPVWLVEVCTSDNPFGMPGKDSLVSQHEMESKGTHKKLVDAAGASAKVHKKRRESCFEAPDGDALLEQLRAQDINSLVVMGRSHDSCIRLTILDAVALKFRVLTASKLVQGPVGGSQTWKDGPGLEWYQ